MTITKDKVKLLIYVALIILFFDVVTDIGFASQSSDSVLEESRTKRIEAMQMKCDDWLGKWNSCYGSEGTEDGCDQLVKSTIWMVKEFNNTPELACQKSTTDYSFLFRGEQQQSPSI